MNEENQIQFDTDQQSMPSGVGYTSHAVFGQPQVPGMAAWLMKKGIIKNETQAKSILVGVVIINFLIAVLVFYFYVFK